MSYGFDPYLSEKNPFIGGAVAVVQSLSKLVSAGCSYTNAYLSLQEFFERLGEDPKRWAKPFSALLGAFEAQERLQIASIGGKDSMSGTFMDMDVPPTLVSLPSHRVMQKMSYHLSLRLPEIRFICSGRIQMSCRPLIMTV
jgi:phosphoribosylformylglycinamidine synthase